MDSQAVNEIHYFNSQLSLILILLLTLLTQKNGQKKISTFVLAE